MKNQRKEVINERIKRLQALIDEATLRATFDDRFDDVIRNFEDEKKELQEELKRIEKDDLDEI